MRFSSSVFIATLFLLSSGTLVRAQVDTPNTFTENLSFGSRSAQVIALQKILNTDPYTRIANAGPGSSGQETNYFGSLTKAAVIRFQEKYASEVLTPAGLIQGNGYVGAFTRKKLNALSVPEVTTENVPPSATSPVVTAEKPAALSPEDFLVKEIEKTDIYAGDKMLTAVQNKLVAAINSIISSPGSTAMTMPTVALSDVPSVAIKTFIPQFGIPGTKVSLAGLNISAASVVRFGENYIIRKLTVDPSGNFSFTVPTISPGYYDVAVQTGGSISSTIGFVVTDPKNPLVHIQSVIPTAVSYGGSLTITGSGFLSQGNMVVTNYQKFTNIPSADGKTLTVIFAPEKLRVAAQVGNGKRVITVSLYVVNNYGFSDSKKSFTMAI